MRAQATPELAGLSARDVFLAIVAQQVPMGVEQTRSRSAVAVFLVSDDAATITGQAISGPHGGLTLGPQRRPVTRHRLPRRIAMRPTRSHRWFIRSPRRRRERRTSLTFGLALLVVAAWLVSGPLFRWSDTWQLVINTGTTIVTFLMVFLIQSTQNRDAEAVQVKLDELLRRPWARTTRYSTSRSSRSTSSTACANALQRRDARADLRKGIRDTGAPELPEIPARTPRAGRWYALGTAPFRFFSAPIAVSRAVVIRLLSGAEVCNP